VQVNIPVKMLEYIIQHKKAKKNRHLFCGSCKYSLDCFQHKDDKRINGTLHRTCFDYIEDFGSGCYGSAVLVIF
jgi:hypothetical protein